MKLRICTDGDHNIIVFDARAYLQSEERYTPINEKTECSTIADIFRTYDLLISKQVNGIVIIPIRHITTIKIITETDENAEH